MKQYIYTLLLLCSLSVLSGCNQDLRRTTGSYTYKTSGLLVISDGDRRTTVALSDEIGQMDIIDLQNGDSVLILQNQLSGNASSTRAAIEGNRIVALPYQRTLTVTYSLQEDNTLAGITGGSKETETFNIRVSSNGTVYDNSILFCSQWSGVSLNGTKTIEGNNLQTIAKRND